MKCVNCGADLIIDNSRMLKYCPYCGQEIEMEEEAPQTMAAAVSGIAKGFLSQRAEGHRYNREHAVEIAEQKRKDRAEERAHERKTMIQLMGGLMVLMIVGLIASKFLL